MTAAVAVLASGTGSNFQVLLDATRTGVVPARLALLITSKADAPVVQKAKDAGVEVAVMTPDAQGDGPFAKALLAACQKADVEHVVLAGFMHLLPAAFVQHFRHRILNVHPALLPAFGGKGMYGHHVHQAVLDAGVAVTGCTVHLVDEQYDHGPVVLQRAVDVLAGDTAQTLAARVQVLEHAMLPQALALAVQGRLSVAGRRVVVAPAQPEQRVRRALISVSNKDGVVDFARGLAALGVEIVSTGGTARALSQGGVRVRSVEGLTGSPEMMDGRVKTLHPRVHGALLYRRDVPAHVEAAQAFHLEDIDLVAVNLYPFAKAAKVHQPFSAELMEEIDIGGPTLIRAAAKNCQHVTVVVDPADYADVLEQVRAVGQPELALRQRLATKVYQHTSTYDGMIAQTLGQNQEKDAAFAPSVQLTLKRVQTLRYGENPHQVGALYRPMGEPAPFEQHHGKELSYNNLLDAQGSWEAVQEFNQTAAVIFKHVTPCGAGVGPDQVTAFQRALETDPVCAFGGILALNRPMTLQTAQAIGDLFLEVIVAPGYEPAALEHLQRKKNLRLLTRTAVPKAPPWNWRSVGSDLLVHAADAPLFDSAYPVDVPRPFKTVTKRDVTDVEAAALRFAWAVCKHVKSNAIVLANQSQALGLGAGQMSRVDSVHMAGVKMAQMAQRQALGDVKVAASDAFFPFRDGLDGLAQLGVTAVVQPGGSVRDADVVAAANEHGMAMVVTGMRHFRH